MPETGTQIVPCEDVRYTNTYEFVDRLTQLFPDEFRNLHEFGNNKHLCRMQTTLGISSGCCAFIYHNVSRLYGIQPNDFGMRWIQARDVSLHQLHHQLQHEADMLEQLLRRHGYLDLR